MTVNHHITIPEEELAEICRRYRVRELALFGSVLRDDYREDSDIDVLVEFEPDATIGFFELARLQRDLAELFERDVDVVVKRGLNPVIQQSVIDSSEILYAKR